MGEKFEIAIPGLLQQAGQAKNSEIIKTGKPKTTTVFLEDQADKKNKKIDSNYSLKNCNFILKRIMMTLVLVVNLVVK